MKERIGLRDKDYSEIREGDIVEFFFCADRGYAHNDLEGHARMVDTVERHREQWFFMDHDIGSGAFAWRHAQHCRVIGNIHDASEI